MKLKLKKALVFIFSAVCFCLFFTGCNKEKKDDEDVELGEIVEDTETGGSQPIYDEEGKVIGYYDEYVDKEDEYANVEKDFQVGIEKEEEVIEESTENINVVDYNDGDKTKLTFKIIDPDYLDALSYSEFESYRQLNSGDFSEEEYNELITYYQDRVLRDSKFLNDKLAALESQNQN